jgi:hypothetical protein
MLKKPEITNLNYSLPFDKLSFKDFGQLTAWLVQAEGYETVEYYHSASAFTLNFYCSSAVRNNHQLWYFYCNPYKKIDTPTFLREVNEIQKLSAQVSIAEQQRVGIIFAARREISVGIRQRVEAYCQKLGFTCKVWGVSELATVSRNHWEIISEFFQLPIIDCYQSTDLASTLV